MSLVKLFGKHMNLVMIFEIHVSLVKQMNAS
jgi:hypothetical protein